RETLHQFAPALSLNLQFIFDFAVAVTQFKMFPVGPLLMQGTGFRRVPALPMLVPELERVTQLLIFLLQPLAEFLGIANSFAMGRGSLKLQRESGFFNLYRRAALQATGQAKQGATANQPLRWIEMIPLDSIAIIPL